MIVAILGLVIAYLLGSISFAVWIGRIFYKIDVRKHGSGNAGTTNTIRVLGWVPGIIVLLLDVAKGWFSIYIGGLIFPIEFAQYREYYEVGLAAAVLIGHIFPIFTGFKGGKGVATMVGIILALYPEAFLGAFIIFGLVFITTRYVSLASITAAMFFPILDIYLFHQDQPILIIFAIAVAVFIPLTHIKNIKRLIKGEESKISFAKKQK